MNKLSRRDLLSLTVASSAYLVAVPAAHAQQQPPDVHRHLLELAAHQLRQRRERFAAVATPAELKSLQKSLRDDFLRLIGDLPTRTSPPSAAR